MEKIKQKSNNGFSMVEMMIIIALIAIITGIGISTWTSYIDNSNLREAARDIEADIKFMQRNARARAFTVTGVTNTLADTIDADYKIIFDKTNNQYTLESRNTDNNAVLFTRTKRLSAFGRSNIVFDSLPGGGATFTLNFLKRGTLSPTNNSRKFVIRNGRNSNASITFGVTGKVYVRFRAQY
jgi:type II secretory pathway pseudopilin PulG